MDELRVYNKKHNDAPSGSIYIGRPSRYGNPFSHLQNTIAKFKVNSLKECLTEYERWLIETNLANGLDELRGKNLICWCAPKGGVSVDDDTICHGQIILRHVNK